MKLCLCQPDEVLFILILALIWSPPTFYLFSCQMFNFLQQRVDNFVWCWVYSGLELVCCCLLLLEMRLMRD